MPAGPACCEIGAVSPSSKAYATSLQQLSSVIIGEFSELELAAFKTH